MVGVRIATSLSGQGGAPAQVVQAKRKKKLPTLPRSAGNYLSDRSQVVAPAGMKTSIGQAVSHREAWASKAKVAWALILTLLLGLLVAIMVGHASDVSALRSDLSMLSSEVTALRAEARAARGTVATLQGELAVANGDATLGEAALAASITDILAGTAERRAFEANFIVDLASLLAVDASRVRVEGIVGGSLVVSFAILRAADGTAITPNAIDRALIGVQTPQLGGYTVTGLRSLPSLQDVVAGRNETALRESIMDELAQLRADMQVLIEQRRRAAEQCNPGEFPTGVGASPCAPCATGRFSSSGLGCEDCPAGTHPDSLASRCTVDSSDVYLAPTLHDWLAVSFTVEDLGWFVDPDAREAMLLAIAAALTLERDALVNEYMNQVTGDVLFELVQSPNMTVSAYLAKVKYALWNVAYLAPEVNITECGTALSEAVTSCVRTEKLELASTLGGPVSLETFLTAVAETGIPDAAMEITSYEQKVAGSMQLLGDAANLQPGTAETSGPRSQVTGAIARALGLNAETVAINGAAEWERGKLLPAAQMPTGRRRQLQSSFFRMTKVDYLVSAPLDISGKVLNTSFFGLVRQLINDAGDELEDAGAIRVPRLAQSDMVTVPPAFQTSIKYVVTAGTSAGLVGADVTRSLASSQFVALLNETGSLTFSSINISSWGVVSSPLPPPPPPPPVIVNADVLSSGNATVGGLLATSIHVDDRLGVWGNVTVGGSVHISGALSAETGLHTTSSINADGALKVSGRADFGLAVAVSGNLDVAGAGYVDGHMRVGSLASFGRSDLNGNASLGSSLSDAVFLYGHIASSSLVFDADGRGGALELSLPDPSVDRKIVVPDESGTILTTGSDIVRVGSLSAGNLSPGFGSASVTQLTASGESRLAGNVTLGGAGQDGTVSLDGIVRNPSIIFDENLDGIGLLLNISDPSVASDSGARIRESCVAIDAATCSSALLNGSMGSCTVAGACTYTKAVAAVERSCAAADILACTAVSLTAAANFTDAVRVCESAPSNCTTHTATVTTGNTTVNVTANITTCVSRHIAVCSAVHAAGASQVACESALANCSYQPEIYPVKEACAATDLDTCLNATASQAELDSDGDGVGDLYSGANISARESRCNAAGKCFYTAPPASLTISFPAESGTLLTTTSVHSSLQSVGALQNGSLGHGFGAASVASLLSRGEAMLAQDTVIGSSVANALDVRSSWVVDSMQFDTNLDGQGIRLHYPDPTTQKDMHFPAETGTILTDSSLASALRSVGALSAGSLAPGFGSAEVASIRSTGKANLGGDVRIGTHMNNQFELVATIQDSELHFAAGRCRFLQNSTSTVNSSNPLSGSLIGCTTDACINHGSLEDAQAACLLLGDEQCGGVTSANNLHFETRAGTSVIPSQENSWILYCGGDLTLVVPTLSEDQRIHLPAENGTLLTSQSEHSSLSTVGELVRGSLAPGFGAATVASLVVNGSASLGHNTIIGSSPMDSLYIGATIASEVLTFGTLADGKVKLVLPRSNVSATLVLPSENGSILTSVSTASSLSEVGKLRSGSIGGNFGDIQTSSDVRLLGENSVLETSGLLQAKGDVILGNSTSTVSVLGALLLRNNESDVVFHVDSGGAAFMNGDLRLNGTLFPGSSFGNQAFNVTTIEEFVAGSGVSVEGVHFRNGTIPSVKVETIDEVGDSGVSISGVLLKNGRLYSNSVCLYTAASLAASLPPSPCDALGQIQGLRDFVPCDAGCAPRRACPKPFSMAADGDGCYQLDGNGADASVLSVSESTITSSKILDLTIQNVDLADGAVTSRNTNLTTLDLTDSARSSGTTGYMDYRWSYINACLGPAETDGNISLASVLRTFINSTSCLTTTVDTGNTWRAGGTCLLDGNMRDLCSKVPGMVHCGHSCMPLHSQDADNCRNLQASLTPRMASLLNTPDTCHFSIKPTGYTWDEDVCVSSTDLSTASFVTIFGNFTTADQWPANNLVGNPLPCTSVTLSPCGLAPGSISPCGVSATHITSGVCIDSATNQILSDVTTATKCLNFTTPHVGQWENASFCIAPDGKVVDAADETECTRKLAASGNTWITNSSGVCLSNSGEKVAVGATWLGSCEGTRKLDILTLTNTAQGDDSIGNTETVLSFRQRYAYDVESVLAGRIAVGTEGFVKSQGTYMTLATRNTQSAVTERVRISADGRVIMNGDLNVGGGLSTGGGAFGAHTSLGDDSSDTLTVTAFLAQQYLLVDGDGDGVGMLNLTFPSLGQTGVSLAFPPESGTLLTSSSVHSTLASLGNVTRGSLAPGFGRADVASLASFADSALRGHTTIGDDAEDALAISGFITTKALIFDTDQDNNCLILSFPDPLRPSAYEPTTWTFVQDITSAPTFGNFLPGDAQAKDDGALIYLNDSVIFEWSYFESVHLAAFYPNPEAHCPTNLMSAMSGGFSSGDLKTRGSLMVGPNELNAVGTYCIGGLHFETTRMALRVRQHPFFQWSEIGVSVLDAPSSGGMGELSWELLDASSGAVVLSATGSASHMSLNGHYSADPYLLHTPSANQYGQAYTFNIVDTGGDGIYAPGGYQVTVDGEVVASGNRNTGFTSSASVNFNVRSGGRTPLIWTPPLTGVGYAPKNLHQTHCKINESNTVIFPSENGTLLVKHDGQTTLDGDLILGANSADSVHVAGALRGAIRFADNSAPVVPGQVRNDNGAVLLGKHALRFGGELWGTLNDTIGTYCRDDQFWPSSTGQADNCSALVALPGFSCHLDLGLGMPADYCKISCGLCHNVSDPHFVVGRTISLSVPDPTEDLVITLPHETGTLLTDVSTSSSLTELGNLSTLHVMGPTALRSEVTLGTHTPSSSSKILVEGVVHGSKPLKFDAGVTRASGTPTNICDPDDGEGCLTAADTIAPPFDTPYAVDGVIGGSSPNRWMSSDSTPYHWYLVYLRKPYLVSAVRAWSSKTTSEGGKLCKCSVQYLPYSAGSYADFSAVSTEMYAADISTAVAFESYVAAGNWVTIFSSNDPLEVINAEFSTVTTELIRINIDTTGGCEMYAYAALFEVAIEGLPERSHISLGVTVPTLDRTLTLPDETGMLLTDVSAGSSLTSVGTLNSGAIDTGFGNIDTGGSLSVAGTAAFSVGSVVAGDTITIPAGKTLVRVLYRSGTHANNFQILGGVDGQVLCIVNHDDQAITADGSYGQTSQISAGGAGMFFFAGSEWIKLFAN